VVDKTSQTHIFTGRLMWVGPFIRLNHIHPYMSSDKVAWNPSKDKTWFIQLEWIDAWIWMNMGLYCNQHTLGIYPIKRVEQQQKTQFLP